VLQKRRLFVRKTLLVTAYAAVFVAASVGVVRSAPKAGQTLSVRALRARIMRSPRFFGPSVARLRRGARVKVLRVKGAWYQVRYGAKRGWIHKNRVSKKKIELTSGRTGGGSTRGEAELAGRGFNPQVEQRFRSQHSALDYSHVDRERAGELRVGGRVHAVGRSAAARGR
jgi:hypothetical protein